MREIMLSIPEESILALGLEPEALAAELRLAAAVKLFEQAESLIWKSQLMILRHLKAISTEESPDALQKHFYESATKEFPEMFKTYDFPSYMSFLSRFDLIEIEDGKGARISVTGTEYLTWRDQQRKAERIYG